jgi:prolyl oligopeptidase
MNGGSNGGLLVAACTNQAEEGLIGASVADVGVMDLLKFHRWTIGRLWTSDYGNPDEPKDFEYVFSSIRQSSWPVETHFRPSAIQLHLPHLAPPQRQPEENLSSVPHHHR